MTFSSRTSRTALPSAPTPRPAAGGERTTEKETWRERFLAALPLFIVGAVCVLISVYFYLLGDMGIFAGNGAVHLRPWILFVALGITALSAGTVAILAEDVLDRPEPRPKARDDGPLKHPVKATPPRLVAKSGAGYPGPSKDELATLTDRVSATDFPPVGGEAAIRRTAVSPAPVPANTWDEAPVAPSGSPAALPKEAWDESPEAFEASASERAPSEVVLHQLDELEASLRKKPVSSRPK